MFVLSSPFTEAIDMARPALVASQITRRRVLREREGGGGEGGRSVTGENTRSGGGDK